MTDWLTLWAASRFNLHLSDEEFWKLEPRQLVALWKRYEQDEEAKDRRAGIIAATIANVFSARGKSYKPEDFMPRKQKRQTWQEQLAQVESYMAQFGEG